MYGVHGASELCGPRACDAYVHAVCHVADTSCYSTAATPVLDLCCHGHERLLHIGGILSTGLKEGDAQLIRECLQHSCKGKASELCACMRCRTLQEPSDSRQQLGRLSTMELRYQAIYQTGPPSNGCTWLPG